MRRDYQQEMDLFYSQIGKFIGERPELIAELDQKLSFFEPLQMQDKDKRMLVLDWFVFDVKSKALRNNPLEVFLKESDLDEETKQLYRNFRQGKFSLFEVKAVKMGKGMLLINLLDGQEHQAFDVSACKTLQKGQCCLLRMLPFEDYFNGCRLSFSGSFNACLAYHCKEYARVPPSCSLISASGV